MSTPHSTGWRPPEAYCILCGALSGLRLMGETFVCSSRADCEAGLELQRFLSTSLITGRMEPGRFPLSRASVALWDDGVREGGR